MFKPTINHVRTSLPSPTVGEGLLHFSVPGSLVLADCLRKWMDGASLNEQERHVVDQALATNRLELMREVFSQEGVDAR